MAQGATLYSGTPTATVFANLQTDSSPLVLDITSDALYYYKPNSGVRSITAPLPTNVAIAGTLSVAGATTLSTLTVTGAATFSSIGCTTISASGSVTTLGQLISAVSPGTPPLVVVSSTNVPNLNASLLKGFTWAVPDVIGFTTANAAYFTTLNATGSISTGSVVSAAGTITSAAQLQCSVATGTAPLLVNSTTQVNNLNCTYLQNYTWAGAGPIGGSAPNSAIFTTLQANSYITTVTSVGTPAVSATNVGSGTAIYGAASSGTGGYFTSSSGKALQIVGTLKWDTTPLTGTATSGFTGTSKPGSNQLDCFWMDIDINGTPCVMPLWVK